MITKLSTKDFDYTGSDFTEKTVIENGYIQLSGKELLLRISNMIIFGDYPMGYKFVTEIYENGTVSGANNVGSIDSGNWTIDFEKHTLQLEWKNAWINTITRAYDVNGNIEFYDINTGNWRTTFKILERRKEE